jgi:hypothetical protein
VVRFHPAVPFWGEQVERVHEDKSDEMEKYVKNHADAGRNLRIYNKDGWLHIPNCDSYEFTPGNTWLVVYRDGIEICRMREDEIKTMYWTKDQSPTDEDKSKAGKVKEEKKPMWWQIWK